MGSLNRTPMHLAKFLVALCVFAGARAAPAQLPVWSQYYSFANPGNCLSLAYDPAAEWTVAVDQGATSRVLLWRWNGRDWGVLPAQNPPLAGNAIDACFDPARGVLVAVIVRSGIVETWELANGAWSQAAAGIVPGLYNVRLHYAPARSVVLLVGIVTASSTLGVWERSAGSWLQRSSTGNPRAGSINTAYDSRRDRLVLFGGTTGNGATTPTWEWDGTSWTQRFPRNSPSARADSGMAYDPIRGRSVMQGGSSLNPFTWEWDGDNWHLNLTAPPPSVSGRMAFDARRGRMVFLGTDLGTWEYLRPLPASHAAFGSGCLGTAGVPSLAAVPGSLPWLGETFTCRLINLPPSPTAVAYGLLGASRTSWLGILLPFDLGGLGAPGCSLLVSNDLLVPLVNIAGAADWQIPIPGLVSLLGAAFFQQAIVLDAGANAFGASFSNGAAGLIGDR